MVNSYVSYCQPPPGNNGCSNGVCPTTAPYHEPTITTDNTNRYVAATGCPPYDNPNWNNPGNACVIEETYTLPLRPKFAPTPIPIGEELESFDDIIYLKEDPAPIFGAIGILINGVVVYGRGSPCGFGSDCPSDGTGAPSEYVDAVDSEGQTIDQCGGHPQNQGQYHIHSGATFMDSIGRQMCDLPVDTDEGEHSVLLGWMFDGFPMYGQYSQGGQLPMALDECHGHTHDIDGVMTYHYHMPLSYPHIIGCFKGCPETSNNAQEFSNRVSQYGCSDGGLDSDPDPVYEVYNANTTDSTTPSSGAAVAISAILLTVMVWMAGFIMLN